MQNDNYDVGYKKPPKQTQFKKGQSGNYKGRPKMTRNNFRADLIDELSQTKAVNEGGKTKRLTQQRIMIKQTIHKAMKGDLKAFDKICNALIKNQNFFD